MLNKEKVKTDIEILNSKIEKYYKESIYLKEKLKSIEKDVDMIIEDDMMYLYENLNTLHETNIINDIDFEYCMNIYYKMRKMAYEI